MMREWLLLFALLFVKERVRYEDGPALSLWKMEVRYKVLFGREFVLSRLWVFPAPQHVNCGCMPVFEDGRNDAEG